MMTEPDDQELDEEDDPHDPAALPSCWPGAAANRRRRRATRAPGLKIAMIAKSSTNPVFLSARTGAEVAAREMAQKHGVPIEIVWMTPPSEDGQVQAQRIAQAVNEGATAVLVSCSDAGKVTGAINDAVARGVPVMTFDSDAPESGRFAFYGVDDVKTGEMVMKELASQMHEKGNVAILAGNQNAPNLRKRVDGVKQEAAKYPGMKIVDTFYHIETPQDAAAEVIRAQNAYPQIQGWAMIGGWALFTPTLLTDLDPKRIKIVSVDALPAELVVRREGPRAGAARPADVSLGLRLGAADRREGPPEAGRPADHPDGARQGHQGEPRHVGASAQGLGLHGRAGVVSEDAVDSLWVGSRVAQDSIARYSGIRRSVISDSTPRFVWRA